MKVVRALYVITVGMLIFVAAVIFTPAAGAQTIHAMLIVMNDAPLTQELNETNLVGVASHLKEVKDELGCDLTIKEFYASHPDREHYATRENILKWLETVRPAPDDVVFFYYIGDGTADEKGKLYLNLLDNEKISRKAIADSMQKLACRLKIFIMDAGSQGPPVTDPVDFFASRYRANLSNGVSRAEMFKHLFFEHEGFLNLTAATEGEFALKNKNGRLFTQALVYAIYKYDDYRSFFLSWTDVFKLTRQKTIDLFYAEASEFPNEMKQQLREKQVESQRPKFYGELPERIQQ